MRCDTGFGLVLDTHVDERLTPEIGEGEYVSDERYWRACLYRAGGIYYLAGWGGALTRFGAQRGDDDAVGAGHNIVLLSGGEAEELVLSLAPERYTQIFGASARRPPRSPHSGSGSDEKRRESTGDGERRWRPRQSQKHPETLWPPGVRTECAEDRPT